MPGEVHVTQWLRLPTHTTRRSQGPLASRHSRMRRCRFSPIFPICHCASPKVHSRRADRSHRRGPQPPQNANSIEEGPVGPLVPIRQAQLRSLTAGCQHPGREVLSGRGDTGRCALDSAGPIPRQSNGAGRAAHRCRTEAPRSDLRQAADRRELHISRTAGHSRTTS
jgi:hypothetical protein